MGKFLGIIKCTIEKDKKEKVEEWKRKTTSIYKETGLFIDAILQLVEQGEKTSYDDILGKLLYYLKANEDEIKYILDNTTLNKRNIRDLPDYIYEEIDKMFK